MRACFAILFLSLCSPAWGADYIKSGLITAPDSVPVGSTIVVQIQGDLPYTIEPKPAALIRLRDDDGNRVLLIQGAVSPGYEISVDFQVIHPTDEELAGAPTVPDPKDAAQVKAFKDYFKAHSTDEFYQDSHTVKVGDGKKDDDKKDDDKKDEDDKDKPVGPYWIVFLEESESRSLETAKILADVAFLKSLTDAGHKWRVYDEDHADAKSFSALTTHRPALIVTTFSGEVVHTVPLPKTAAEITELLKGGKQ